MSMEFGKLNFSVSFNPTSAFPLDARSYFESYDAAVAAAATADAAGSSTTTYYYGETIAVVENGVATLYTIQPDRTLSEVGAKVEVNENIFAKDADGKLSLLGFADAVAGAQLLKTADGKLSWVKPDQTTVEGLQTTVAGLQTDVENLTTKLGDKTEKTGLSGDVANLETRATELETKATELETKVGTAGDTETAATGLYAELKKKADASTVYTKEEADTAIASAVAGADHLQRVKVNSVEDIDVTAEGAEKFIYLVPNADGGDGNHYSEYMVMDGAAERVGDWKVDLSEYAKTADVNTELDKKVDKVDGSRLMTTAEGTKLEGIEAGAQVNKIESVDEAQFTVDEAKKLTLLEIAMGKVTGLTDALAGKVDIADDSRLMTNAEGTKLEGIEAGAQVNKIESVDETQFKIDDAKKLTLLEIAMGKVTGLTDALEKKVDAVEGKGLSTNDLTDELLTKLNNADANVIEAIKVNGAAVTVAEDKSVDIAVPISSADENKVSVKEDHTMEVNAINVNKLVQTEGDVLILNGGASKN